MSKLDAVFIHASAAAQVYQALSARHSAIEPPIWLGMLAEHCRSNGFAVHAIDCEAEHLNEQECADRVAYLKPRIVVFVVYGQQPSASAQNMSGALDYADWCKRIYPDGKVVLVGGYPAAEPKHTLAYNQVDFICQNEGVYTIRDLLSTDDLTDRSVLRIIKGLGWKDDGAPVLNPINQTVSQSRLEVDLPGIAWDLLPPFTAYRTAGWHSWPNKSIKSPFASLYTSLGCSFKCSFCMINIINRTVQGDDVSSSDTAGFRYWPPEFIIKQFDHFAACGVRNIKIADELFVLREAHFLELCRLITERRYDFNIWCYARIDTCKPEWLDALKKAGVNFLGLGIESPDQAVRKDVVKGGYKEVKIEQIIKDIQNTGIGVGANYILGLPKDTHGSMAYTVTFARTNLTENFNIYSAMAYPGSRLYIDAKRNGIQLPDRWAGYSQHSYWTQNLPSETLTAAEILRARDIAWTSYFSDQAFHNLLRSRYGEEAVRDVTDTTRITLKRRLFSDQEPTN